MNRCPVILLISAVITIGAATALPCLAKGIDPAQSEPVSTLSQPATVRQSQTPAVVSRWPAAEATHSTSKISVEVGSYGLLQSLEFPPDSGGSYLWQAALWIGGVIGNDTLVSAAFFSEQDSGTYFYGYGREFYPPNLSCAVTPAYVGPGTAFRTHFVDTFTSGVPDLGMDYFRHSHIPLNLAVVQKSYSLDIHPYRSIVLLDFITTNIGHQTIEAATVGLLVDGDACGYDPAWYECYQDDLSGSLRDISTGYIIDNDGDPEYGRFQGNLSPLAGLGVRPVMVYPPVTDTNFNWFLSAFGVDFGPRQRGTPTEPFRDFQTGTIGNATGDINRHYVMSHSEWDYDQVFTAAIDSTDSVWLHPDPELARDISWGWDTRFLLSVGPVDLMPDSSMRAIFALFTGEFVHVDPTNRYNLQQGDYWQYYHNLHFDILRQTAQDAVDFANIMLDPMLPPTGLKLLSSAADTAVVSWDSYVLPEVTGYNVYLRPVPDSFIVGSGVAIPPTVPIDMGNRVFHFPAGRTQGVLRDLQPGRLYFVAATHVTGTGEGRLSVPIVAGYDNLQQVSPASEFAFFDGPDQPPTLTWTPSDNPAVRYYRIYRTLDPTEAVNRYQPFIADDSTLVEQGPTLCRQRNEATYCYYEMEPYDATVGNIGYYVDSDPVDGAVYWVSPVGPAGYPGPFSDLITAHQATVPTRDIVVILGATSQLHDYVYADSLVDYYSRLLEGFDYDIYNWYDTNLVPANCDSGYCVDWHDLTRYNVILVEEFPAPKILSPETEPVFKLLKKLFHLGRDIVYFGTPPGNMSVNLSSQADTIRYDSASFEATGLGLEFTLMKTWKDNYDQYGVRDTLAGFNRAEPAVDSLPRLTLDTIGNRLKPIMHHLFETDHCLPLTGAFSPGPEAQVLYRYGSRYPTTSELRDRPCGLLHDRGTTKAYVFSFHLWAIEETAARQLIEYVLQHRTPQLQPERPPERPLTTRLHHNYPNPFNDGTRIMFDLRHETHVTLEIFNILGQQVSTLVDETRSAAAYEVDWNGRDNRGRPLASGVYFYRLKTGEQTVTRKMVLLR
ncbi:MAG: T9SS type A sorting domain-containing protein [bacterium]